MYANTFCVSLFCFHIDLVRYDYSKEGGIYVLSLFDFLSKRQALVDVSPSLRSETKE